MSLFGKKEVTQYPPKVKDVKLEGNPQEKEKPKPFEVKIPDDILKKITDFETKKNQLINMFLNLSFRLGELKDAWNGTRNKIKDTDKHIGEKVDYAFRKLRLKKRKNYKWTYDRKRYTFVGTLIPEPKKEEKK